MVKLGELREKLKKFKGIYLKDVSSDWRLDELRDRIDQLEALLDLLHEVEGKISVMYQKIDKVKGGFKKINVRFAGDSIVVTYPAVIDSIEDYLERLKGLERNLDRDLDIDDERVEQFLERLVK